MSPQSFALQIAGKVAAHWLLCALPLVLLAPLLGLQFGLAADTLGVLMLSLLIGTPLLSLIGSMLKTVPGVGTLAGGLVQGVAQALITRWVGNVFVRYLQNEMQPPPGGLAEVARTEWRDLTTPESLRRLISLGREHLTKAPGSAGGQN